MVVPVPAVQWLSKKPSKDIDLVITNFFLKPVNCLQINQLLISVNDSYCARNMHVFINFIRHSTNSS